MKKYVEKYKRKWYVLPWFICGISVIIDGNITRFQYGLCLAALLYFLWNNESVDKFSNFGNDARKGRYGGEEDKNTRR